MYSDIISIMVQCAADWLLQDVLRKIFTTEDKKHCWEQQHGPQS